MKTLPSLFLSKVSFLLFSVFFALRYFPGRVFGAAGDCRCDWPGRNGQCYIEVNGGPDLNQGCAKVVIGGPRGLPFLIPTLSDILTFAIRAIFIVGGLAALLFLLLGAISWITSGGDKENVQKAQGKITNAIIGVILIAVVLAVIVTLEQVVFGGKICLGLSCPITIPSILQPSS